MTDTKGAAGSGAGAGTGSGAATASADANANATAAAAVLDLLGFAPPLPDAAETPPPGRLFEDLFVRFQARVPFREGLGSRGAGELLEGWVSEGSGGGPSSRTAALLLLARTLGFDVEPVAVTPPASGRAGRDRGPDRPVLLARLDGRQLLADAGLPLPGLLPLDGAPPEGFPTGWGRVRTETEEGEVRLLLEAMGDERLLWRSSLRPMPVDSFPADPADAVGASPRLFRLLDDRVVRWQAGRLVVEDAWGRLDLPFAPGRGVLEELFAQPLGEGAEGAVSRAGEGPPTMTVRDGREGDAGRVREILASLEGHAALLPPGVVATETLPSAGGWTWTLRTEDGAVVRRERVGISPAAASAEGAGATATVETLEGKSPYVSRRYEVEELPGAWRLLLTAQLAGEIPPRGLPEGTRKALTFALVSEILAFPDT